MTGSRDHTKKTNTPITYAQLYQYAKTGDNTIRELITNASPSQANQNLATITSYSDTYCKPINNPFQMITHETYLWAKNYATEGVYMMSDGYEKTGGIAGSPLVLPVGWVLLGLSGLAFGAMTGLVSSAYHISKGDLLEQEEKNAITGLKRLASDRISFFKQAKASSNNKRISNAEHSHRTYSM